MKHLSMILPHGSALQMWTNPGQLSQEYRLLFDESQAVAVRDWLCGLANDATDLAVQVLERQKEKEEQVKAERKRAAMPDQTRVEKISNEERRLKTEGKFQTLREKVIIPESNGNGRSNVVKDDGQNFAELKVRSEPATEAVEETDEELLAKLRARGYQIDMGDIDRNQPVKV